MWWKRKPEDFKAEVEAHLQLEADELRSEGLAPREARDAANRAFGNRTSAEERFYESGHWMLGQHLMRDLRFAARVLMKDAKFSLLAVLGLALGIGVSTGIFSVLKFMTPNVKEARNPESYVGLENRTEDRTFTYADYQYFKEHSTTLTEICAESGGFRFVLGPTSEHAEPEEVVARFQSASFLSVLGLHPALGRTFSAVEEQPGNPPVAILNYRFWQRHFASDLGVIGKTIFVNTHAATIVGVADRQFDEIVSSAIYFPLELQPLMVDSGDWLNNSERTWLTMTARLRPFVPLTRAQAEANVIGSTSPRRSRPTNGAPANSANGSVRVNAGGENPKMRSDRLKGVFAINFIVSMILLIACSNLANLLLARTTVRRREIGVRLSLGASRARVICQLLTESLLLAFAGGGLGLVFSSWLAKSLMVVLNPGFGLELTPQPRVILYGIALTLVTGISFGLGPALAATKTNVARALHSEGMSGTPNSPSQKILSPRNLLVVIPLAVSLMLLIGAAFQLRAFQRARIAGPVFDTSRMIGMSFRLGAQGYDEARTMQFQENLRERVSTMPGVGSVALARVLPLDYSRDQGFCFLLPEGSATPPNGLPIICNVVSTGYFETLGVPLVRGRAFLASDRSGSAPVAIVSQAVARRYWPDRDPIRRRFRSENGTYFEVVGVAPDLMHDSDRLQIPLFSSIYVPLGQERLLLTTQNSGVWNGVRNVPPGSQIYQMQFLIRAIGEPANVKSVLRQAVRAVDPSLLVSIQTIEETMELFTGRLTTVSFFVSAFGVLALVMASVGIYALLAYAVSQRTHEIGIRMALGAQRLEILSLVMRRAVILIACGIALGLAGAMVLTRILSSGNADAGRLEAAPCLLVALLLGIVSLFASYLPARKALRVDPMQALRCD